MKIHQLFITITVMIHLSGCGSPGRQQAPDLFSRENLIAWCIVPFDAGHRTPEQRAVMLRELGISQFAYDYRDEHIPSFREEIETLERYGIDLRAVWLWIDPPEGEILNEASRKVLGILEETGTETELWVSFPAEVFEGLPDSAKLSKAVGILSGVLQRAEQIGCTIALYNHGDWFGEPENQVRIIEALGSDKVKIVYNFHHGHQQMDRFRELLDLMLPYLSAININGMRAEGPKIITLGEGDRELEMLRMIVASGYSGPIGNLGHTEGEDIRPVLERNLEGLGKLKAQL
jgi:sugar phosphate isomerase/epimerase